MKSFFRLLLNFHFRILVKILLYFKRPYIVLVVGGGSKSLVKEKIKRLLLHKGLSLRFNERPYNTTFGILLTILDLPSAYSNLFKWIFVYLYSFIRFVGCLISFPKYLILEGGIDSYGESKSFIKLLNPDVVVFSGLNASLEDDFESLDLIESEFARFVDYLNGRFISRPSLVSEGTYDDIVDLLVKYERGFGVVNVGNERIKKLGDRLIRKISVNF